MSRLPRLPFSAKFLTLVVAALLVIAGQYLSQPAYGAQLGNRRLQLSDADISATANYLLSFNLATAGTLGSIAIQFCSNDPLPNDPCTIPAGLDTTAAVLATQTGPATGFSIGSGSTANELILTRVPAFAATGAASYEFTTVTNPSSPGSYYVRVQTYPTADASGPASDYGGIAFAIVNTIAISAEVPPYLLFCTGVTISGLNCANAAGDYIDFGELLTTKASSASSQMLVASNAQSGYNISVSGTTLTSGINAINAITPGDVSRPGVSQFGFNLRANTTPPDGSDPIGPGVAMPQVPYNQPDIYRFVSGDTLVATTVPDNIREFTASYIVNRPVGQAPGIYVSTLTYIALATF